MNWQKEVEKFKTEMQPVASKITVRSITFGFFGSSGGGKSVTSGVFAIGITPDGLIGWIDGEAHRSDWAIDAVAELAAKHYGKPKQDFINRFVVVHIEPPFNPLRVIAAMEVLEAKGCKTIICDILTQVWSSDGGYLDMKDEKLDEMAGDDEAKRRRAMAAAAAQIKPRTHQKLVNRIEASKSNLVLLFQAKKKFNANTSKPNEFESPIQESGLTRTALAVGLVSQNERGIGGYCSFDLPFGQGTKYTHGDILKCLPHNNEQFHFRHAEAILQLCGGVKPTQAPQNHPVDSDIKSAKKKLWEALKTVRGAEQNWALATEWLLSQKILPPGKSINDLNAKELLEAAEKAEIILNP